MGALLYILLGLVFGFYVGYRIGSDKNDESPKEGLTDLAGLEKYNARNAEGISKIKAKYFSGNDIIQQKK